LPESPRPTGEVITRLDSFLRALDVRLLLILKADADSPRVLDLLTCYAHDFKALAAADGDSFDHEIKLLVDALTKQAKLPSHTRAKDRGHRKAHLQPPLELRHHPRQAR
jgi:hypothetical protein